MPSHPDSRPPRVFLGLNEVAGYLTNLRVGLLEIGIEADLHDLGTNLFGYGGSSAARAHLVRLAGARSDSWRRKIWDALLFLNRGIKAFRAALLLPWAAVRYDAFVLEGRDLFFNGRGLWLLHRLGKPVVVVFLGSDHRPPYLNGIWINDAKLLGYARMSRDARSAAARVRRAERYADVVIALPTSAQFHRERFVHLLHVGIPMAVGDEVPERQDSEVVRILHCPTNVEAKGSREIVAAVDRLKQRGLPLDLHQLNGVSHQTVLDAIRACDFVVDELYSDTPMAVFSAEAASFGRASVVGSYAHDQFADLVTSGAFPPTAFCHPEAIETTIEALTKDEEARRALGERSREFVIRRWAPAEVAMRVATILNRQAPEEWFVDPHESTYVNGWGTSEASLTAGLGGYLRAYGTSALHLGHRPDLIRALEAMASGRGASSATRGRN